MKLISWSIVNNEYQFLKDTLDFHLKFIDQMYFLDTGSTDKTLEYLLERSKKDSRIILEQYSTKYIPEYDQDWFSIKNPFPEVEIRNYALQQVEKLNGNWLIQIDGDEIFLPKTKEVIEQSSAYVAIGHSTINPVASLEHHPKERRGGKILWDPHTRIWRPKKGFKYIQNPAFRNKQFHCIPVSNGKHLYSHPLIKFIDEPVHFHLHWMYGTKVEGFYKHQGIEKRMEIVTKQAMNGYSNQCPELFWQRRDEWLDQN